jgi:tRNA threonylcarbamoyladenosine biosynthesis protein TsaB
MILAINTTTLQFSLALVREDGAVAAEYLMSERKGHFGNLMPALDFILTASDPDLQSLKAVVVALGPGSFTGLRVGLAMAKGIAHARSVPLLGASSLEALAGQVSYADLPIAPILDSRRGELFTARFVRSEHGALRRELEDASVPLNAFPDLFRGETLFVGNDLTTQGALIREHLGRSAHLAPPPCWGLRASAVGALGLVRYRARDFDDLHRLTPIYLRPPDIRPGPPPPGTPPP